MGAVADKCCGSDTPSDLDRNGVPEQKVPESDSGAVKEDDVEKEDDVKEEDDVESARTPRMNLEDMTPEQFREQAKMNKTVVFSVKRGYDDVEKEDDVESAGTPTMNLEDMTREEFMEQAKHHPLLMMMMGGVNAINEVNVKKGGTPLREEEVPEDAIAVFHPDSWTVFQNQCQDITEMTENLTVALLTDKISYYQTSTSSPTVCLGDIPLEDIKEKGIHQCFQGTTMGMAISTKSGDVFLMLPIESTELETVTSNAPSNAYNPESTLMVQNPHQDFPVWKLYGTI